MPLLTPELWPDHWLPRAPYATDNLEHGLRRGSRTRALELRYLEASPKALQSLIVIDVDNENALMKAFWKPSTHPEPSWASINPENGHGHVGWILETPIVRTDSARLAPMRFAARVETGLRDSLEGDVSYSGLITKNPRHPSWETAWGSDKAYSLKELAEGLGDLFPRSLPKRVADSSGLGRNCALFNSVRLWAYSAISRYWGETAEVWEQVALAYALNVNEEFNVPMTYSEVKHLARSVARWTRRNITEDQTAANRKSWGTFLSQKAADQRAATQLANSQRITEAAAAESKRASARALAESTGLSARTVRRVVAVPRADYLNTARARGLEILALRAEGKLWREIAQHFGITETAAKSAGARAQKTATA